MTDEYIDRIVESLAQVNVNLESLRVSLGVLHETKVDHEQRLRSIERWREHLTALLAVFTFFSGAVTSVVIERWL